MPTTAANLHFRRRVRWQYGVDIRDALLLGVTVDFE